MLRERCKRLYLQGRHGSYEYGRYGNPTTRVCEEKVRALEVRGRQGAE